ncbi:MAG: type IX secretion system protein PorQ [Bacteroidia bacterium]|nr:type IX secretion system protein PorQ [Bacteroidia bacterium]
MSLSRVISCVVAIISIVAPLAMAQSDETIYDFLRLPYSTRAIGLGGKHITLSNDEPGLWTHNPALLRDTLHAFASFDAAPLTDGIWTAQASYSRKISNIGTLGIAIQHIGYGNIDATDQWGESLGNMSANENALILAYNKQIAPYLYLGASIKPVWSHLTGYNSFGLCMDFGLLFRSRNNNISAALAISNIGGQITSYDADGSTNHQTMRPQVAITCALTPQHAPIHLILTVKDLHKWDLTPEYQKKIEFADCLLRHCIIGVEFQPAKSFYITAGYDQRKRRELRLSSVGGTAGLSWGLGIKIAKRFDLKYAMSRYHLAGTTNSIGISTKLF